MGQEENETQTKKEKKDEEVSRRTGRYTDLDRGYHLKHLVLIDR